LEKQNVNKNHKIPKMGGKPPKSKKFVKFWKACELKVISSEASEDRVKFRNLSA
jgi:hypothetical protein